MDSIGHILSGLAWSGWEGVTLAIGVCYPLA